MYWQSAFLEHGAFRPPSVASLDFDVHGELSSPKTPLYPLTQAPHVLVVPAQPTRWRAVQLGALEQSTTLRAADAMLMAVYAPSMSPDESAVDSADLRNAEGSDWLPLPVLTTTVAVALADDPYASVAMPYIVITLLSVASPAGSTDDADAEGDSCTTVKTPGWPGTTLLVRRYLTP